MVSRALLFFVGHYVSRVRVECIESIPEDVNITCVVFEVIYVSPLTTFLAGAHYTMLTHVADVAYVLHRAKEFSLLEENLVAPFLVVIFYQSGMLLLSIGDQDFLF
jgi:hypothetical protein